MLWSWALLSRNILCLRAARGTKMETPFAAKQSGEPKPFTRNASLAAELNRSTDPAGTSRDRRTAETTPSHASCSGPA